MGYNTMQIQYSEIQWNVKHDKTEIIWDKIQYNTRWNGNVNYDAIKYIADY